MRISSAVGVFFGTLSVNDVSAFLESLRGPPFRCTEWSRSLVYLASSRKESRVENFLQMDEKLSYDETNARGFTSSMYNIEQALSSLVDEKVEETPLPRPPGTPPPLHMLQNIGVGPYQENMFVKSEVALEKERERLERVGAETMGLPLHEREVLRRAEEVLLRSRAAAKKRMLETDKVELQGCEASEGTCTGSDGKIDLVMDDTNGPCDNLSYRGLEAPRKTVPLASLSDSSARATSTSEDIALDARVSHVVRKIPTLFNWIHCADGSIRGQIYNSNTYPNGTEISTSIVPYRVTRGTAIETSSGSVYFLEAPKRNVGELNTPHDDVAGASSPGAPFGTILAWKVLDTGGIAGLLYGCAGANDGDYVETSPVASGVLESGQMVVTESGSQYFLSHVVDDQASNIVAAFQDMSQANYGSTITLTKQLGRTNQNETRGTADGSISTRPPRRRSTFSIFGLMGRRRQHRTGGATGPDGLPMLTQWTVNPDTTITGIVSGSPNLCDGDVVTTTEIVAGVPKRFGRVTTSSGSTYFLA